MANVPVLQVQVDDSQWREFLAAFEKFKIDAADVPGAMAAIDRAVERLPEHLRPATEALEDASEGASDALDGAGAAAGSGGGSGGSGPKSGGGGKKRGRGGRSTVPAVALDWTLSALGARRFGSAITGATRDLARWERLTAVFSGLLGAGGLYGLNNLAARGAERRRESSGLGVSSGQYASFETNYARLGDVGSILGGLSTAETDITKRQPLLSAGIDPAGKNSLQIMSELLPVLKKHADEAARNPSTFEASLRPYNFDQLGVSMETMRLISRLSQEEIDSLGANARRDAVTLEVPDDVGRKWQDLITTFHKAEASIQTALADDLVQLTPGLMHLSDTAVDLVDHLLERKELKDWLSRANDGLLWFADEIGSNDAQTKFKDFLHRFDMAKSDFDALNAWFSNHGDGLKTTLSVLVGARLGGMFGPLGAVAGAATGLMFSHSGQGMIGGAKPETPAGFGDGDLPGVGPSFNSNPGGAKAAGDGSPAPAEYDRAEPIPQPRVNETANPASPHAENDKFLNDRSRRELAGVNAPLAENLLEASKRSGIQFQVNQGRRTQAEADANAASGIGVKNSQHLYGAAADVVMIDPRTGQKTYDRSVYEKFAQSFNDVNKERGTNQRWLGASGGRWGNDIVHFDQGIGYGQSHAAQPYGHGAAVTKADLKDSREDAYRSPANPFRKHDDASANVPKEMQSRRDHRHMVLSLLAPHPDARPKPPQSVKVVDNSGGEHTVTVAH